MQARRVVTRASFGQTRVTCAEHHRDCVFMLALCSSALGMGRQDHYSWDQSKCKHDVGNLVWLDAGYICNYWYETFHLLKAQDVFIR